MNGLVYLVALLFGVVAGLRALTAPAVVAWAVHLGRLDLTGSWLAFLGNVWVRWILTVLALGELVTDQLPSTPSRKVAPQFGARLITGALSGAAIGASAERALAGALAGLVGAVIGTLGGSRARSWLARLFHNDHPAALIEDVVAIGGAVLIGGAVMIRIARAMTAFDAIVIGAGQAGPPLAGRLTGAGMKVALVERALFGGTCVNTGCTPTKTMVASAYAAHLARRAGDYGVGVGGAITVDLARVKARADAVVARSRDGVEGWLRSMPGCTVLRGRAAFESPTQVRVGDDVLSAPRIFINVGGRASVPRMPGVGEVPHLDNSSILALTRVPEHLVVVGGSYVGLEFAQMFRRFGAAVTIVEMKPHLIPREDVDVSSAIEDILRREGITLRMSAKCIGLGPHERGVAINVACAEGEEPMVVGSHLLLAVGRRPNTDDLGLERAGVATDARGFITVDDALATNVSGIWALGDCNGRGAFTHTAYNDFEIVAANLLDGARRRVSERIPAYALYVDPPLGRVGMTETAARASGRPLLVGSRPMTRVGRAVEKGETQGLMKVVADAESRQILGAAILGVGGDEAIHGVLDMMNARATIDTYRRAMPIHPTVSELIPTVLGEMKPAAVG